MICCLINVRCIAFLTYIYDLSIHLLYIQKIMNSGTLDPTHEDPSPDIFHTCWSLCWGLAKYLYKCLLGRSYLVSLPVQSHTVPSTLPLFSAFFLSGIGGRGRTGPTDCHPGYRRFIVHPKRHPRGNSGDDSRPIDLHKVVDNFPLDQESQYKSHIGTWQEDILVSGWQG